MFVFQQFAQKPSEQAQNFQTQILSGKDAQKILQGVMPVCEQMLLKIHGV